MSRVWTNKKYKLDHSENFDEFLTAIGINFFLRKVILASSFVLELVDLGDGKFILKQQTAFKSMDLKFEPGVEFMDEKPNGAKIRSLMEFESENVLIHKQFAPDAIIRREFKENEVEMVSERFHGCKVQDLIFSVNFFNIHVQSLRLKTKP